MYIYVCIHMYHVVENQTSQAVGSSKARFFVRMRHTKAFQVTHEVISSKYTRSCTHLCAHRIIESQTHRYKHTPAEPQVAHGERKAFDHLCHGFEQGDCGSLARRGADSRTHCVHCACWYRRAIYFPTRIPPSYPKKPLLCKSQERSLEDCKNRCLATPDCKARFRLLAVAALEDTTPSRSERSCA